MINTDWKYDNGSTPVTNLTCGTQFEATGNTTYRSLLQYPYAAGFSNVTSGESTVCGACYVLEWAGNYVGVQIIDGAEEYGGTETFTLSGEAYDWLLLNETTSPVVTGTIVDGPFACPEHQKFVAINP
ncbi:hypothetical protein EVJ58_g1256 [Rhodofomes roseus]|uniref:Uncharacterized protein n=1 Tax=Rhodofomes roseus TaxID=34475 RepID=A0A4Y9Z2C9_9APHY|nr:hypothetical protein EVJ58_g1256 [Rhodofomes roseus]